MWSWCAGITRSPAVTSPASKTSSRPISSTTISLPSFPKARQGVRAFFTDVLGAFTDRKIDIFDIFATDEKVCVPLRARGQPHPATGRATAADGRGITCGAISMFRVADGKLAEGWESADLFGLFNNSGAAVPHKRPGTPNLAASEGETKMIKVFEAPRKYVQGAGALAEAGKWIAPLGRKALAVWGSTRPAAGRRNADRVAGCGGSRADLVRVRRQLHAVADRGRRGRGQGRPGRGDPRRGRRPVDRHGKGHRVGDLHARSSPSRRSPATTLPRAQKQSTTPKTARWTAGPSGRPTPTWCWWTARSWSRRPSNGSSPAWAMRWPPGSRRKPPIRAGERPSRAACRRLRRSSWPGCATNS